MKLNIQNIQVMEFFVYIILLLFGLDFLRKAGVSIYYAGQDLFQRSSKPDREGPIS